MMILRIIYAILGMTLTVLAVFAIMMCIALIDDLKKDKND